MPLTRQRPGLRLVPKPHLNFNHTGITDSSTSLCLNIPLKVTDLARIFITGTTHDPESLFTKNAGIFLQRHGRERMSHG